MTLRLTRCHQVKMIGLQKRHFEMKVQSHALLSQNVQVKFHNPRGTHANWSTSAARAPARVTASSHSNQPEGILVAANCSEIKIADCWLTDDLNPPEDSIEDVVAHHRRRNPAPRLPSTSQLAAVRHQQRASISTTRSSRSTPAVVSSQDEVAGPPQTQSDRRHQQRAISTTRVLQSTPAVVSSQGEAAQSPQTQSDRRDEPSRPKSRIGEAVTPSQLQFYPPAFRDIIERAKQFSHCDAASINAFPHRTEFNRHVQEYVDEAIQERRAHSLLVPDGKSSVLSDVTTDHAPHRLVAAIFE